jgi:hypothetical protein
MAAVIFYFDREGRRSSLEVNDATTITFRTSNPGWAHRFHGSKSKSEIMSVAEAKARWPSYARAIDKTIRNMVSQKSRATADLGPL